MRRITLTVVTTLAILVLLFSYRTSRNQSVTAATVSVASAHVVSGGSAAVVSSAAGPDPSSKSVTVPSTSGSTPTSTAAPSKTRSSARSSGSKSTTAAATTAAPTTTKVDGAAASTPYGDIQVEVTITGGKITDVQPLVYPNQDPRDQQINADALPQLQAQVLAAQSANISGVSGATYTSQGYVTSLQSALDAAKFK
ncbi:FMN-binding domain-containing protein [Nakamurella panacisegetis]|uniref:FMN-binding domain-containing protein n=1 Tax=Nakamurella panacisegetis TaxID=1090615 RepID=A0A1H0KZ37_9ACTN|nr:FMN-binding protein [Nakamurella panacisegetis]SDO61304.1 FMN-binding domain-containing protein [Nakamurella panacisegetis]